MVLYYNNTIVVNTIKQEIAICGCFFPQHKERERKEERK